MTPRHVFLLPFGLVACNVLFGIDPPTEQDDDAADVDAGDVASPCGVGITSDGGIGYVDISAGQPAESGHTPKVLIDTLNSKLLVVTEDGSNQSRLGLFRCNLDGTCCNYRDISANLGARTGFTPAAVIDEVNHKLLVTAVNSATSYVNLFRCELDGSGCTSSDVSGGVQGQSPAIVIDDSANKLLVVTITQDLRLARCELDGSQCAYSDLGGWHYFRLRTITAFRCCRCRERAAGDRRRRIAPPLRPRWVQPANDRSHGRPRIRRRRRRWKCVGAD